jgi:endonuclease G, mitochondrial
MKKLFLLGLILFVCQTVTAQTIKHHSYTAYYRAGLKESDSVSWDLTPAMRNCADPIPRKDAFAPDPALGTSSPKPGDYAVNSGKPRSIWINLGHLYNAEDASCDEGFYNECYYTTNMLPQYQSFNTGDWKKLEIREQKWAKTQKLHIIAGGIGSIGSLPAGENIPKFMYKAIYMNGGWQVWIMLNDPSSKGHDIDAMWKKTVQELDALTGLHL